MFELPKLNYSYDALKGYISEDIMILHHSKHHQAYVDKFNVALANVPELKDKTLVWIMKNIDSVAIENRAQIKNNGGGHYNHSFFWKCLSPVKTNPSEALSDGIIEKFGSFDNFINEFNQKALGVFGSGWVWLMPNLDILISSNQDNPLMLGLGEPILCLDVWEHAYYLDYKNRRDEYVKNWWNIVDWEFVSKSYSLNQIEG